MSFPIHSLFLLMRTENDLPSCSRSLVNTPVLKLIHPTVHITIVQSNISKHRHTLMININAAFTLCTKNKHYWMWWSPTIINIENTTQSKVYYTSIHPHKLIDWQTCCHPVTPIPLIQWSVKFYALILECIS